MSKPTDIVNEWQEKRSPLVKYSDVKKVLLHYEFFKVNPKKKGSDRVFSHPKLKGLSKYRTEFGLGEYFTIPHVKRKKVMWWYILNTVLKYLKVLGYLDEQEKH